mmetsp:Transcript_66622/g.192416  ORF Transcript_66622/g.192416 Transcript_66622/m.192416 type:complete len:250 (-) Transcript_66622:1840-2589(-)
MSAVFARTSAQIFLLRCAAALRHVALHCGRSLAPVALQVTLLPGTGGLASDERLLGHLGGDETLPVDSRKPGVRLRLSLLFDDPHVGLVDLYAVFVDAQVPHDEAPRREELMLIVTPLHSWQPLQYLLAVLHSLLRLDDDIAVLPHDFHNDDIDDALNLAIGHLVQCRLPLDQLLGEVLKRPCNAGAQSARVHLVCLHELLELLHLQTQGRVDQRGEAAIMRKRGLDALGRAFRLREPCVRGLVALPIR